MLCKVHAVDFFYVQDAHQAIHERLENWARYVHGKAAQGQAPIWRLGKSNGRQWHQPELKTPIDTLDGHKIEKAVGMLPAPHRDALRWSYYWQSGPSRIRRMLAVTDEGLIRLINDGRRMLINRAV